MRNILWALAAIFVLAAPMALGQDIKPAVFAGQFYPGDPARLAAEIDGYLARAAPDASLSGSIIGLIVPHAGYVYSGQTGRVAGVKLAGETAGLMS